MPLSESFLLVLVAIFLLPWLVWRLINADQWAPLVVVQIVTGILLGPGIAGALWPAAHALVFTPQVLTALSGLAWWAVILFVFLAGLELDMRSAWASRRDTLTTATCALLMPLALGALVAWLLWRWLPGFEGPAASGLQFSAAVGMACAVTALPILMLFLQKLGVLRTAFGQRVLRYASLDDVAIWAVLALVLLDWERLGRQLVFLAALWPLALGVRRWMPSAKAPDRLAVALIWLLLMSLAADWAGLHFMVGAFLAGLLLDAEWFGHDWLDTSRELVLMLLMPVFFLSTGLRTDWALGGQMVFAVAGVLLVAAVVGKLAGVGLAGRLLGWQAGDAWRIGWLLQTKALIMILFANVLLDKGIISAAMFTALLLMAVASTVLTLPVVSRSMQSTPENTLS
ncbi:cation:proton antiporter [Simiduia agarivorans]|uniref:Sodium/hydrogen exchanger n=1 Tax=Simiduia agarivorans (strain DSM 21679 / JCM 13881 / BCRC 17597 / SA1) TaxID=1117647 RepID=K4KJK3_SIMAS|nr:cation:proton antiporter [Simiduia agarivorans]AFU99334.1 sodium/hydrogen exchanger [Simiduia agarivorans SA1 = DSM 21679]